MNQVESTNKTLLSITKRKALSGDMMPLGISRIAVRGFFASNARSRYRLKAMAALLAVTMQMTTKRAVTAKGCR